MRNDIAKLVTERPRAGHKERNLKSRKKVRYVYEPEHEYEESYDCVNRGGCKVFSDNLGFLRRLLRKQVGRPWDDIYSEFCEKLGKRSLARHHVLNQHIKYEVELKTAMGSSGVEIFVLGRGYVPLENTWAGREILYVHPVDGTLCRHYNPKKLGSKRLESLTFLPSRPNGYTFAGEKFPTLPTGHKLVHGVEYCLENHLWFMRYSVAHDIGTDDYYIHYNSWRKKQLNKRERKKLVDWLAANFGNKYII